MFFVYGKGNHLSGCCQYQMRIIALPIIFILGCQSSVPISNRIDYQNLEPFSEIPLELPPNKECIVLDQLLDQYCQEEERLSSLMDWNYTKDSRIQFAANSNLRKSLRNKHSLTLKLIETQNVLCQGISSSR